MSKSCMAEIPAPERLRQEEYKFGVGLPKQKETKILTVHFQNDSKGQTAKEAAKVGLYQTKKLYVVKQITHKGTCETGEPVCKGGTQPAWISFQNSRYPDFQMPRTLQFPPTACPARLQGICITSQN